VKVKRTPTTAAELSAKLEADPVFVAQRAERDRKFALRASRIQTEQQQIVDELKQAGCNLQSLSDLINRSNDYDHAISVLVKHLLLPYSDVTRETLARALAMKSAAHTWPILVAEYQKAIVGRGIVVPGESEEFNLGAKDGLACALAATVTEATIEELIEIMKDPSHGSSRVLMVSALRKSKNHKAKEALEVLAFDPDLQKEIAHWQNKKARPVKH
jgi:hypothetical protein